MNAPIPERPVLEVGWVLDARLDAIDRKAAEAMVTDLRARLLQELPAFDWRLTCTHREIVQEPFEEPTVPLEAGASERALHHWDFAVVVTSADLRSHYLPECVGVLSRTLGTAVLSTFRIDPYSRFRAATEGQRHDAIRNRLLRRAHYLLARLGGLPKSDEDHDALRPPSEDDLDDLASNGAGATFTEDQRQRLTAELLRVADERVEEERDSKHLGTLAFYLRATLRNRREIADAVASSRWWEFPIRMTRLSTAALSALALLLVTAETWEVGTQLGVLSLAALAVTTLGATTALVIQRQHLLALSRAKRPTEQGVVGRTAVVLIVLLGMLVTYVLALAVALALELLVVRPAVVSQWSGLEASAVDLRAYAAQAAFTAGLALLVGGLGASFEGRGFVRHIAHVDEEL